MVVVGRRAPRLEALLDRRPELGVVSSRLDTAFELLVGTYQGGGTVYVGGNGGSAADAEHIVGELMKGMDRRRPLPDGERRRIVGSAPEGLSDLATYLAERLEGALPSVCLTSQTALTSAVANDTAGDMALAQQVYGYGRPGDVFWGISTSGSSRNVVLAALAAKARGIRVLGLTGEPGQPLAGLADVAVPVPARHVGAAQELHQAVYHALCGALEDHLFPPPSPDRAFR